MRRTALHSRNAHPRHRHSRIGPLVSDFPLADRMPRENNILMRTLAGILLAAALLLSISGFIECFPGLNERAWKWEIQRLSADGRPSEILSHVQTDFRRARESRIEAATACFLMAALLFYLGWVATTRLQTRLLHLQCIGSILLSAALLASFYGFVKCFPSEYERGLEREIHPLPADWRASENPFNLRYARESRIQTAIAFFVIAALLSSLGWIAIKRAETRHLKSLRTGPIILPAKPRLLHLRRFSTALLRRSDRIQGARAGLRPKLERLFEHHTVKDGS
jgi:hypothetical protein